MRSFLAYALVLACFFFSTTLAQAQLSLPGFQAQLESNPFNPASNIGGTVTIVDAFTLRFEGFSYAGVGAGESDIVLLPLADPQTDPAARFNQIGQFFFDLNSNNPSTDLRGTAADTSVTLVDQIRGFDPSPAGNSPAITSDEGNFTVTIGRDNFEAGSEGDARFNEFLARGGTLGFSTLSVFCHPALFDFGSGVFLPPEENNSDFVQDGSIDGADFLAFQQNANSTIFDSPTLQVPGDANFDGIVDDNDLVAFQSQFGTEVEAPIFSGSFDEEFPNFFDGQSALAAAVAVPEPSSVALLGIAGGLSLLRRKR